MSEPDPSSNRDSAAEAERAAMLRRFGLFSVIVAELIGCTGAAVMLGYYAMTHWGAPWWVLLLLSIAGLSLGMYQVYRISQKTL